VWSSSVACMASFSFILSAAASAWHRTAHQPFHTAVLHCNLCVVCRYLADIVAELRHPRVSKEGTQTRLLFKKRMFRYDGIEAGLLLVLLLPPILSKLAGMPGGSSGNKHSERKSLPKQDC